MDKAYVVVEDTARANRICLFLNREKAEAHIAKHNDRIKLLIQTHTELIRTCNEWTKANPAPRLPDHKALLDKSRSYEEVSAQFMASVKLFDEDSKLYVDEYKESMPLNIFQKMKRQNLKHMSIFQGTSGKSKKSR